MPLIYRSTLRPAAFTFSRGDPERAHDAVLRQLAYISRHPALVRALAAASGAEKLHGTRELFGLQFRSPIGLAAGFDKNGLALPALAALGFGFLEAGGVTQHRQPGHPRPRIWRYARDEALINAMGFPNHGSEAVAAALRRAPRPDIPVGWNVAKSMVTPLDDAADDYCATITALHPYADFFVLNVSSPNTPGLRGLQDRDALDQLLTRITLHLEGLRTQTRVEKRRPLLVKIAPDVTDAELDDIVAVVLDSGIDGIVATNTSVQRHLLRSAEPVDRGGLSGRAIHHLSVEVVRKLSARLAGRIPIIGVGGVSDVATAQHMLDAGASLVQVYTGLIYQGPGLVRRLNRALRADWLRAP